MNFVSWTIRIFDGYRRALLDLCTFKSSFEFDLYHIRLPRNWRPLPQTNIFFNVFLVWHRRNILKCTDNGFIIFLLRVLMFSSYDIGNILKCTEIGFILIL